MQIFVINLARRRDRLDAMTAQMQRLNLSFDRVPALDARNVSADYLAAHFAAKGPLGVLPKGDECCSLSHRRAWSVFLSGGASHAVILEDDVVLDGAAATLLRRSDWIPADVDLLKLEHFGPAGQRVLVGAATEILPGYKIARIHSRHTGAAAYVISRRAGEALLAVGTKWTVPVDHLLFNANVSPIAARLRPCQMLPAIARQREEIGGGSDIRRYRIEQRKFGLSYFKRELRRAYYELRLLPRQIACLAFGQGSLVQVRNDAAPAAVSPANYGPRLRRAGRLR